MIVLHEPKLIFLKSGKVAGTSFEIALSKFADADSIITPVTENDEKIRRQFGFRGPQNFRAGLADIMAMPKSTVAKALMKRRWPSKFYNHISPKQAKQALGDEVWQAYEKIAIVRDPFDYAISCYFLAEQKRDQTGFRCLVPGEYRPVYGKKRPILHR